MFEYFIPLSMTGLGGKLYGTPSISPDDDTFQFLARKYSSNHRTMSNTGCDGYAPFTDGITNGAEWYIAFGQYHNIYIYIYTL